VATTFWDIRVPIQKLDPVRGLVTGWAALSTNDAGEPVVDHQGDHIPIAELERAAHRAFLRAGGEGMVGDMHERRGVADLVESFVVTAEKREALGFGPGREGWVVTVRIRDPGLLREVLNGSKLELSIRGKGRRIPMGESDA
jgi:hypothetical protein